MALLVSCGGTSQEGTDASVTGDAAQATDADIATTDASLPIADAGVACGNGVVEDGELCDEGENNSDSWASAAHCNASCSGVAAYCGDGAIDSDDGEACDDGPGNNDLWEPLEHCNSSCSGSAPLCDLPESPANFPHPGVPYPVENPHTDEKALLGKILFWEQQLSADNTVACGSCHQASGGGSDGRTGQALHPGPDDLHETGDDVRGSEGIRRCEMVGGVVTFKTDPVFGDGVQVTRRKAPSYLDAMFAATLFWDGRAGSEFLDPATQSVAIASGGALENQVLGPLLSPVEMSCESRTLTDIVTKLAIVDPLGLAVDLPPDVANAICKYPSYPQLFASAFGDPQITGKRIAFAIATHERTLVSDNTPYDRFTDATSPDPTALSAAQQSGLALFQGSAGCADCHSLTTPNADAPAPFSNQLFHSLGFSDLAAQTNPDLGLQEITGLAEDQGKFKTPTMRNVSLRESGGLLHTGYGETLEDVMAAYNNPSVPPGPGSTTDARMIPLGLSSAQIAEIIDFLRNGLTDPRVASESYPFDHPTLTSN